MPTKRNAARKKKRLSSGWTLRENGTSPAPAVLGENDDASERSDTRRERRAAELAGGDGAASASSPYRASPAARGRRRPSIAGGGGAQQLSFGDEGMARPEPKLSARELSDLYEDCIKLSAQGKINVKNTWNLSLIGVLSDLPLEQENSPRATMSKKTKSKAMTNFQKASATLEASAKIYATRVDSTHSETYKVMSGLSRTVETEPEDDADGRNGPRSRRERQHKVMDAANTLEDNVANINAKSLDVEFDIQSTQLFHKTSAAFDEGGARGLLLAQIGVSEGCNLVFEGEARLNNGPPEPTDGGTVPMALIDSLLAGYDPERSSICPSLSHFEFTGWTPDQPVSLQKKPSQEEEPVHRVVEAPCMDDALPPATDVDFGDLPDMDFFAPDDYDGPQDDGSGGEEPSGPVGPGGMYLLADVGSAGSVASDGSSNVHTGAASIVARILSNEGGNDFSYFNDKLLKQNWAGPSHWKVQRTNQVKAPAAAKRAAKQERSYINFGGDDDVDYSKAFQISANGAGTRLTAATLKRLAATNNQLPDDVQYDITNLTRLFSKPHCRVRVRCQPSENGEGTTHRVEWYDYDNANDAANFVGGSAFQPTADDDDDDGFNAPEFEFDAPDFDGPPTDDAFGASPFEDTTDTAGDVDLISAPERVEALTINYDKVAKKVDVKNLKQSIWRELVQAPADESAQQEGGTDIGDSMKTEKSFNDVLSILPSTLPPKQRDNVSVPFCFICLLHLANEKGLEIHQDGSDLRIAQQ